MDVIQNQTGEMNDNRVKEHIKWRSRRGLLELDLILTRFLAKYLDNLSVQEQEALLDLLTCDDIELWGMVSNKQKCANTHWQALILQLQQTAQSLEAPV